MRIGIEINGVLRNTLGKLGQTYQKYLIDKTEGIEYEEDFKYEIIEPIENIEVKKHFKFRDDNEMYSFLYEEFPMEIFGHSQSSEYTTFNDLNDLYMKFRDKHDILIVSDEIGKSKPATLFFLSKFGCLVEKIKFYSNITIESMWDEVDLLLTSNPTLLLECPKDKLIIKFETEYNKNIESFHTISSLREFEEKLNQIENVKSIE